MVAVSLAGDQVEAGFCFAASQFLSTMTFVLASSVISLVWKGKLICRLKCFELVAQTSSACVRFTAGLFNVPGVLLYVSRSSTTFRGLRDLG